MRILHVTDCYLPLLGGIEVQVSSLAREQHRAGHDVAVLTATPARPGHHGLSREVDGGVPVYRMAARVPSGAPVHPWPLPHARRLLARLRPDVVHLHVGGLTPSTQAIALLVRRLGLPAVVTVHSIWGPVAVRAYAVADAAVGWSRGGFVLTTVSELAAGHIRRAAPTADVGVLRNGVDAAWWRRPPLPREGDAVHVVAAGRFAPRKRMLPALEVLRRTRELLPASARLTATLPGEGPQLAQARAFVAEHGLGWVDLPGRLSREELAELYRRTDVYLAPGVDDAFSVAVVEAHAAGPAVLTRSQSGVAEVVADGVGGLHADDDEAMARALARLVTDGALLARIVEHNRTSPPPTAWPSVLAAADAFYARAGA
jgi:glycogen(starch) synthase